MAAKTSRARAATAKTAGPPEPLFIDFTPFEGRAPRHMQVHVPTAEQLGVWQGIGETFTRHGAEWDHQNAAIAALPHDHPDAVAVRTKQNRQAVRGINRSIRLIKSILVEEADHDWADDMIMEGATIEQMLGLVSKAVDAMRARARERGVATTPDAPPVAELTE